MKLLLDTHIWLWSLGNRRPLGAGCATRFEIAVMNCGCLR